MIRIADLCYRKRRFVLVGWILALVLVFVIGGALSAEHRADYQTPGSESAEAYDLLGERFAARGGDSIKLVFSGDLDAPAARAEIDEVIGIASGQRHVASVVGPFSPEGASQVSQDGDIAYAEVFFDATFDEMANEDAEYQKEFLDAIDPGEREGVQIEVSTFIGVVEPGDEFIGLIFAAFVLLLAFGSLLAMGLPIVTALFGLGIGAVLGGILSRAVETPDWVPTVAIMIGLGTGIDYSLFIVTRYRQALRDGLTPREATITAMGTAGRAVLFAGATVIISLIGMLTMGLGYLQGLVTSSVLAVLAVLAASLTLLPAILGFVGTNIDRLRVPFTGRESHQGQRALWYRWSRVVQHHPWTSFIAAAVVLLALTIPLFSLRLGFPDEGNNRESTTSRQAYDLLTEGFGPGFNGPLLLVADLEGVADPDAALSRLGDAVSAVDGVAVVVPPIENPEGDTAIVTVFPDTSPQAKETEQLVGRLRELAPEVLGSDGGRVLIGGFTAISIDQSDYISDRLPLFIGAVVLLSFLLLTTVFRSPLVALKAGIMNLLSIAAAYGVMAYATQGNWFGDLVGIPETPVPAFVPMINFAILFGLSMDYEVFLLSRIREEYVRTGDNREAVADGLAATARVITAAAAIMVFVFGVFIFDPNVFIKQIGLGLTAAVFIDATIVRMVLVPSTMELLGKANWWMPKWLDKVLPEVHIEGEAAVEAELRALLAEHPVEEAARSEV